MTKAIFCFSILSILIFAQENSLKISYTSLKDGVNKDFVVTALGELTYRKSFLEHNLDILAGVTGSYSLNQNTTPTFFSSIDQQHLLINKLSADLYMGYHDMVSVGREKMQLNLLNGSFDGFLWSHQSGNLSVKTYYFRHYTYLTETLYENKHIENLKGITINYAYGNFDSELTYFHENNTHRSDLYIGFIHKPFKLGLEHLQLLSPSLPNERAYKLHTGVRYRHLYLETGYIDVYDGALDKVYTFGGSEFNTFGLTGFLNRQNAKQHYINLIYNAHPIYTKIHLGKTDYDVGAFSYIGKEAGMIFGYRFEPFPFTLELLTQKSNQAGFFGARASWVHTNLEYKF